MTLLEFKEKYGPFRYKDFIAHVGTPHDGLIPHSGRYEFGSGKDPYQRALDFQDAIAREKEKGTFKTDKEMAQALGMTTAQFISWRSISKDEIAKHNIERAYQLKQRGMSNVAIGKKMGTSEGQVRAWLKQRESGRRNKTIEVSNVLKEQVEKNKYIDVGSGTSNMLGVSDEKLRSALMVLEPDGYRVETVTVKQVANPRQKTKMKVLVKADPHLTDTEVKKDIYNHLDHVVPVNGVYLTDNGETIRGISKDLVSIDPKRVKIRYKEDGGVKKDGVIELNPNAPDLTMHDASYCQVRIKVGDKHYLKGMAVYGDPKDFPKGTDIIFNTNKTKDVPALGPDKNHTVLKILKDDPDNPFGATIKTSDELLKAQTTYIGKDGKEHQSPLNIVHEEGDWEKWRKTIASQMLSKQPVTTAKKQLKIALDEDELYLKEIEAVDNPVVRKKLLEDYAGDADTKAVRLRGAAFPRQKSQVLIPLTSIKPTEVYAPNYIDGEQVALVRYPHGGKFEMPLLTVNNRNREGRRVITPNAADAIGINYKVAEQLSGADFDGDTVLVIPTKGQNIKAEKARKELVDFNPSESYPAYEGMPTVGKKGDHFDTQKQMGIVSNLITDMTIKGADIDEIIPVVKYSMVVIDAEKHNLNWKQAEKDFNLAGLKKTYQLHKDPFNPGHQVGGASTLISMAKGQYNMPEINRARYTDDPETGKRTYATTNKGRDLGNVISEYDRYGKHKKTYQTLYKDEKTGGYKISVFNPSKQEYEWQPYTPKGRVDMMKTQTTKMAAVDDAYRLSSGTKMEDTYAWFANSEKALANQARKEALTIETPRADPAATKKYKTEVASLKQKLDVAKSNSAKERQAQRIASTYVTTQCRADPVTYYGPDGEEEQKKLRNQVLKSARRRTGADKIRIVPTSKEWEAIQNRAISATMLNEIMANADMDVIRDLAMPKNNKSLNAAIVRRIKSLASSGYTNAEIAQVLKVSTSTVSKYIDE